MIEVPLRREAVTPHPIKGFRDRRSASIRKASDDRAPGEYIRVGSEHHRCHGPTRGEPGDKDALAVNSVSDDERLDHLADRESLAGIAPDVMWHEPVEAEVGIVRTLLLGEEQRDVVMIGKTRPSGTVIVARRRLRQPCNTTTRGALNGKFSGI